MVSLLTIGTFDLFHSGHADFLQRCSLRADHVTVAVNPDQFVLEFKGRAPIVGLMDRMTVLRACRYVDEVLIGSGRDSGPIIDAWSRGVDYPRVLAIGADWQDRDYMMQLGVDDEFLRFRGIGLLYLNSHNPLHSSLLRERLGEDDLGRLHPA